MGWASAKLFELVATSAANATGKIEPETLVEALHTVKNETLGGLTTAMTFGPSGATPRPCYFVMEGDGTGSGYSLPFGSTERCRRKK